MAGDVSVRFQTLPCSSASWNGVTNRQPMRLSDMCTAPRGPRTCRHVAGRLTTTLAASVPSHGSGQMPKRARSVAAFHTMDDHVRIGATPCRQSGSVSKHKLRCLLLDWEGQPQRLRKWC